jgi:hypothetical protein
MAKGNCWENVGCKREDGELRRVLDLMGVDYGRVF